MKRIKNVAKLLIVLSLVGCADVEDRATCEKSDESVVIEEKNEEKSETESSTLDNADEVLQTETEITKESATEEVLEYDLCGDILQISVDEEGLINLETDESEYVELRNSLDHYNTTISEDLKSLELQGMEDAFSKVSIHRADKHSLSFIAKNYMEDHVNGPKYLSFDTYNYETATGKLLALEDVITQTENINEIIKEQINKYYSDKTLDENFLDNILSENGYKWVLSYQGITFYFPSDIFGETETTPIPVSVLFKEKPDIFAECCKEVPQAYVMDMDSKCQYLIDTDGDGDSEKVNTVYYVNDAEDITKSELIIDDKTITCNSYIGFYSRYCRTYFVHTASDKNFMIVYMDTSHDITGEYVSVNVSVDYAEPVESEFIYLADYRITDPYSIVNVVSQDPIRGMVSMKTVYELYDNGEIKAGENTIYEYYDTKAEVLQDIEVSICDEITGMPTDEKDSIVKGEIIELIRTDYSSWCDVRKQNGKLVRIAFEEPLSNWEQAKIKGEFIATWYIE